MVENSSAEQPFFSVIICAYNRAALLPRALNSLLSQTESSYEPIIIDDGSEDETRKLAEKYCALHNNFKFVHCSHSGVAAARNTGLLTAGGEYITFLDSDDEYKPEHLAIRKQFLSEHPEIDLLHGGAEIIGSPYVPDIRNPKRTIHLDNCVIGGTFFIRRSVLYKIGGFPEVKFGDDAIFFKMAKKKKLHIAQIDVPTYIYHRDSEDSICNKIVLDNLRQTRF
ncbi:MAG: glycosyltransferase family 2 protein [Ignavibacteria bacterium]|nr:glycosyltransferase family 2 protein [Ignavibacteria bacterium]